MDFLYTSSQTVQDTMILTGESSLKSCMLERVLIFISKASMSLPGEQMLSTSVVGAELLSSREQMVRP